MNYYMFFLLSLSAYAAGPIRHNKSTARFKPYDNQKPRKLTEKEITNIEKIKTIFQSEVHKPNPGKYTALARETIFDKKTLSNYAQFDQKVMELGGEYTFLLIVCSRANPKTPRNLFLQRLPYPEITSAKEQELLTQNNTFPFTTENPLNPASAEDHLCSLHRDIQRAQRSLNSKKPETYENHRLAREAFIAYAQQNSIDISKYSL